MSLNLHSNLQDSIDYIKGMRFVLVTSVSPLDSVFVNFYIRMDHPRIFYFLFMAMIIFQMLLPCSTLKFPNNSRIKMMVMLLYLRNEHWKGWLSLDSYYVQSWDRNKILSVTMILINPTLLHSIPLLLFLQNLISKSSLLKYRITLIINSIHIKKLIFIVLTTKN